MLDRVTEDSIISKPSLPPSIAIMNLCKPDAGCGKVLEVGHVPLVSRGREEFVRFVDTSFATLLATRETSRMRQVLRQAVTLFTEISRPEYRLIVFRCFGRFIWRKDRSLMVNGLRWLMSHFLAFCLSRRKPYAKLVIVDLLDELTVDRRDLWLLEECDLYFKRELAQNVWTTLLRVQPPHGEYLLLTRDQRFREMAKKFRPISIGISEEHLAEVQNSVASVDESTAKRHDFFFAGPIEHSAVRAAGLRWLQELQEEGYAVYVPKERLPRRQFYKALSASWLVWSPEGSGWDCYRHYEACLAGSVPVINFPSIQRYAPLLDGIHCFYYAMEGDDLLQKIRAALSNKSRLAEMACAARKHVLEHHTCERLGAYILTESRALTDNCQINESLVGKGANQIAETPF